MIDSSNYYLPTLYRTKCENKMDSNNIQEEPPSNSSFESNSSKSNNKRKRFLKEWPDCYNDEDFLDSESNLKDTLNDDSSSNSNSSALSGSSNSTNSSSYGLRANKIKHGHKILVTEDKMSEALRDLQIEIDQIQDTNFAAKPKTEPQVKVDFDLELEEDLEGEKEKEANGAILISNELKAKLREYSYEDFLLKTQMKKSQQVDSDMNKLQVVLYSPIIGKPPLSQPDESDKDESVTFHIEDSEDIAKITSAPLTYRNNMMHSSELTNHSNSSCSSYSGSGSSGEESMSASSTFPAQTYKVEEPPSEFNVNRKLKRKFSQLNKILIEEMSSNNQQVSSSNLPNFYLVDDEDSEKLEQPKQTLSSESVNKLTSGLNIEEISSNESEEMEI